MVGKIITARHGRPDVDRGVKITSREYGDWWADYDRAGLAPGQTPPQSLIDVATDCDIVLSSTLPRAIETAARLTGGARPVPMDAVYIEAPLPPPPIPLIKLTPTTWGVISRTFWFWGYAPGDCEGHLAAWARVRDVTSRLIDIAEDGKDVLLCAHGYLNWMIDRHIRGEGWSCVGHNGGNNYWSYRTYTPKT